MAVQKQNHRSIGLSLILAVMLFAGTARIALAAIDDYLPEGQTRSVTADATGFRRSAQIVAVSLSIFAARYGFSTRTELRAEARLASRSDCSHRDRH